MDLSSITAFEEVNFSPFLKNRLIVPSLISLLLFSGSPCRWPLYFCRVGVLNSLSLAPYCIGFIFWRRTLDHSAWAFSFVNFDSYWSRLALYLFNTWGHISVFFPGFRLPMHVSLFFLLFLWVFLCLRWVLCFPQFSLSIMMSCSFSFRWGFLFLMLRSRPSWWHFRIPILCGCIFPKVMTAWRSTVLWCRYLLTLLSWISIALISPSSIILLSNSNAFEASHPWATLSFALYKCKLHGIFRALCIVFF